jgi:hypothetical protein
LATVGFITSDGAFTRDYVKILEFAAENIGCKLPDSTAVADPKVISVLPADTGDWGLA